MAQIIAIANQKGGVGKTTTALALATGLLKRGRRVLLVDLDPQTNATDNYKAKIEGEGTLYDMLVHDETDVIQTTPIGDIIAGDPLLKDAVKQLEGVSAPFKLRKGLDKIKDRYDYIVLDTPPTLSVLLTNALTAADHVVVPLTSDRFGLQGLVQFKETVTDVREYTNPKLNVSGLLLVKYNGRANLAKAAAAELPTYAEMLNTKVFDTKIRESIKAREAQAARQSLFDWAPGSTTAEDYNQFVDELIKTMEE